MAQLGTLGLAEDFITTTQMLGRILHRERRWVYFHSEAANQKVALRANRILLSIRLSSRIWILAEDRQDNSINKAQCRLKVLLESTLTSQHR